MRPALRYAREHLGVEVFMCDRQTNDPVAIWLDVEWVARKP